MSSPSGADLEIMLPLVVSSEVFPLQSPAKSLVKRLLLDKRRANKMKLCYVRSAGTDLRHDSGFRHGSQKLKHSRSPKSAVSRD
jgi:hypothetical protein